MPLISCVRASLLASLLAWGFPATAASIDLIGLFPGKAVLVVDGRNPKTYAVGSTITEGIKLVAVSESSVTLEENGKRQTLALGGHFNRVAPSGPAIVKLHADARGHYFADGQINGASVKMLVDTGASVIALPASEAERLRIDYRKGERGFTSTANGIKPVYRVKLDSVRVGTIEINQVDASVHEGGLPIILLGMSFLNRTAMQHEGAQLTLSKRY